MVTAAENQSMELEGNLRTFKMPDILRFLAMGKMTGTLILQGSRSVKLAIRRGKLAGVFSDDRILKLGQLLVYSGLISRKDLEDTLYAQNDQVMDQMLGEMLIERQLVTSEQVESALRLQIKEELWELFTWDDGKFKFEHGAAKGPSGIFLELDIEELIDEGAERMEHWDKVKRNMNDLTLVFRVRGDIGGPPEARLKPNSWRVLSLINGRHNIRMLICLSGLGKFETLCALDELIGLQLIELADTRNTPEDAAAAAIHNAARVMIDQAEQPPEAEEPQSGGGLMGFFGRRKKPATAGVENAAAQRAEAEARGQYESCVAYACAVTTQLLAEMASRGVFGEGESTAEACRRIWSEEYMRFPRADMISVRQGRLHAGRFDRYVELSGGICGPMTGCLEDSMAALSAIVRRLAKESRNKLQDKADSLLENSLKGFRTDRVNVNHPAEFNASDWIDQCLGETKS